MNWLKQIFKKSTTKNFNNFREWLISSQLSFIFNIEPSFCSMDNIMNACGCGDNKLQLLYE
jgi:hypothetical protein